MLDPHIKKHGYTGFLPPFKVEKVKLCRPEESYGDREKLTRGGEMLRSSGMDSPPPRINTASSPLQQFRRLPSEAIYHTLEPLTGRTSRFADTLNGVASATGRTVLTIVEIFQQADGRITIAENLRPHYLRHGSDYPTPNLISTGQSKLKTIQSLYNKPPWPRLPGGALG